jgi:hypothetical protein
MLPVGFILLLHLLGPVYALVNGDMGDCKLLK